MPGRTERAGAWAAFWYAPGSARNLAIARILLAGTALWVVLSRFDLPSVLAFPPELWDGITPERRLRFLMIFGLRTEQVLYGALHLTLVAALVGVWPRVACFLSALLLYHFAPFETVFSTPNPYLRGLTLPTLGLLVLACSPCGDALALWPRAGLAGGPPSWRYRWPLVLVQVLLCEVYLFAGYSKLVTTGPGWVSADTVRGYLLALNQVTGDTGPGSWGYAAARLPGVCWAIAGAGLAFELTFPVVLFSVTARWIWLPVALVFHAANALLFHILFHNLGLLFVFVDWDRVWPGSRRHP